MAFRDYYMRIGDCYFNSPAIQREGYSCNYRIVQVTDNNVAASGKLIIKTLEHKPTKITITFPVMTIKQLNEYKKYWRGEMTDEDEMFLTCEFYIPEIDDYIVGTFYHTDIISNPVIYNGERMVILDAISFIEH